MKLFTVLLATCCLLAPLCGRAQAQTDLAAAGMDGKIKSVTEYNLQPLDINDMGGSNNYKTTTLYDERGMKVRSYTYAPDGMLGSKVVYKHDGQDRIEEERNYNGAGQYSSTNHYKYDGSGHEILCRRTGPDNKVFMKTESAYDNRGNLLTEKTFGEENDLMSGGRWQYDSLNNPIEEIAYDADEHQARRSEYKYDGTRLTEVKTTVYGLTVRTTYKYDTAGNVAEESSYNAADALENRITYTYNETGSVTGQRHFSADGHLQKVVACKNLYDRQGNLLRTTEVLKGVETITLHREIVYY